MMPASYQKNSYRHCVGFELHHTTGFGANESTLDYPHTNMQPMLIYFLSGSGNIKIEGNRYDLAPGDAVVLTPGELFHCTIDDNTYHERIVLYFRESYFHSLPLDTSDLFNSFYNRRKGIGNLIPAQVTQNTAFPANMAQLLRMIGQTDSHSRILCLCNVLRSLVLLDQLVLPPTQLPNIESHVDSVLTYINAHYTEDISIDQIAQALGMNKSYLSHLFKDRVGMSLWNYVILRRLHRFNALIQADSTIEQACYQVGFQNYSNFFRLYKKHIGMTPLQYKKQLQK